MTVVQNMVLHGRRAGSASPKPKSTVISGGDLDRLRAQLDRDRQAKLALERAHENVARLAASKERQTGWSNTLAGQRRAKLEAKRAREEAEEAVRVEIDLEEEIYRASQRKKVIDKAKKLQFREQDRAKEFHSALLHSEVLKERDYQIMYKKEQATKHANLDEEFQARAALELERGLAQDAEKRERMRDAARKNRAALQVQQEIKLSKKADEKAQWINEGVELSKDAELYLEEEKKKKEKAKLAQLEYVDQINLQKEMINELAQFDAEQEAASGAKREKFLTAKAKMTKLQKEKMKSIFNEKQAHRGKMADKLAKEYREQEDNTEALLAKAQAEKDFEQRMREEKKRNKQLKDQNDINEHRTAQLKVKELANEKRRQMAAEELLLMQTADQKFQQSQIEKAANRRTALEGVTASNLKMINDLAVVERKTRDEQYHADLKQLEVLKLEEDEFQQYADEVIKQAEARQRNTIPLKVVKARGAGGGKGPVNKYGIRPSYLASDYIGGQMPTYHNEISTQIKSNLEPGAANQSKQRLGFTW